MTQALPLALRAVDGTSAPDVIATREDERAAVQAAQRGEREAFDRLVARYQRDIYRLCFRYVNNHEDANDMAQDVFLRAYKALGRFRGDSAFSTWLYRIAVNTCLNFKAARRPPADELPETLADRAPAVSTRVEQEDEARRVREAVSRLPEKQRATLILKVYQDMTHEEVARVLGSTVGTVKANLFHALGNLRKALGVRTGEAR
ncbi:MAG TPA: sigma-70 family RNA polymerase sigma factor [Vicinamibacteria bacterium]